jgi:hypothetical protein
MLSLVAIFILLEARPRNNDEQLMASEELEDLLVVIRLELSRSCLWFSHFLRLIGVRKWVRALVVEGSRRT